MRLSFKFLIGLWLALLLLVGVLFYNAYGKLRPEVLISLISESAQRNYPGTKVVVDKIDYHLSVDFNLSLTGVVFKRNDKILGSIGEVEFRVPWWLLLFHRGNAQINLNDISIYIVDSGNNPSRDDSIADVKHPKSTISISLPEYLTNAQFTLRAKNLTILNEENSHRVLTLSKLLVKEFKLGKNSAFEVNIPVSMKYHGATYKSELWLFGDLTPEKNEWNLNYRGEFRTSETGDKIQLEDLVIDGKSKIKPHELDIRSTLTFFVEKDQVGTGVFNASEKEFSLKLTLKKFPLSYLSPFEKEISNPYLSGFSEKAEGLVMLRKYHDKKNLKLTGNLVFPGVFNAGNKSDLDLQGKWRITFVDSRWETSFISPQGKVSFFRRSYIDFKEGVVAAQYTEELGFSDIDFAGPIQVALPIGTVLTPDSEVYFSTSISYKNCKINDRIMGGTFKYGISPDLKFYQADLKGGQSSLNINFQENRAHKKLDLKASKFVWDESYKFLQPYFQASAGVLDGKLEGRWSTDWTKGHWLSALQGNSLQGISGDWFSFLGSFWKVFGIESSTVLDQKWKFSAKNGVMNLESLLLEGPEPTRIGGQVEAELKRKSFLVLDYPMNLKLRPLRKEILEPFWKRTPDE